jgi:hypothetical protein
VDDKIVGMARVCGVPLGADVSKLRVMRMEFVMPASRYTTLEQLPAPEQDEYVTLSRHESETLAVLTYSWAPDDAEKRRREAELLTLCHKSKLHVVGRPFSMFYDAPFTVPFMRRNEAAVQIEE